MDLIDVLGILLIAGPYVTAVLFALLFFLVLFGMIRTPLVAIALVLGATIWEISTPEMPIIRLGVLLSPFDIVFSSVALAAALRLVFIPRTHVFPRPLLVLVAVLLGSFIVGVFRFGVRPAGVDFRNDFYFWTICFYIVTFAIDEDLLNRALNYWMISAFAICLLVWYRWIADAFQLSWVEPFWRYADVTSVEFTRVAASSAALVLGLAAIVSVGKMTAQSARAVHYIFLPPLLLTVVFLQHRSVWVATLVPLVLLVYLRPHAKGRSIGPALAVLGSIAVVAGVLGSGVFGGATESVAQQAAQATSTTGGTFVGRVAGWQELVKRWASLGPIGLALGEPFGSGYVRHIGSNWGGSTVEYAPHNYFVAVLLRGGVVGLCCFVMVLWFILRTQYKSTESTPLAFAFPFVIASVSCIALYCIPYSPTPASGIIFGIGLSIAAQARRQDIGGGNFSDETVRTSHRNRSSLSIQLDEVRSQ